MTKDEFEKYWAAGANISVEQIKECGMTAVPCDCGEAGCRGWAMAYSYADAARRARVDPGQQLRAFEAWGQGCGSRGRTP